MKQPPKPVKVFFEFEGFGEGARETESMWAVPVEKGFRIDNIPFYVREIAWGDVVKAAPDSDGILRFESLFEPSGHSTLRLWFAKDKEHEVHNIRQQLREMNCDSELSDLPRLVAVDVPPTVFYPLVRELLDEYEKIGLLEYEESCLGQTS